MGWHECCDPTGGAGALCNVPCGERSQEANETGKDPVQKHARYPPRSKFLTPELTRIRRMYAEKAVSCGAGARSA